MKSGVFFLCSLYFACFATPTPQVIFNADRDAMVIWEYASGLPMVIVMDAVRQDPGDWQSASQISSAGAEARYPCLTREAGGAYALGWQEKSSSGYVIRMAQGSTIGSAPSSFENIPNATTLSYYVQPALSSGGRLCAVWQQFNSSQGTYVPTAAFKDGSTWEGPTALTETGTNTNAAPRLVSSQTSSAMIAVWEGVPQTENVPPQYHCIEAAILSDAGTWGEKEILSTEGNSARLPEIAYSANGEALVLWRHFDGIDQGLGSARYASGVWTQYSPITITGQQLFWHRLSMNASGTAMLITECRGGDHSLILSVVRNANEEWGTPMIVREDSSYDLQKPDIAMLSNGQAIAVWVKQVGDKGIIESATFDGSAWSIPAEISSSSYNSYEPRVVVTDAGEACAVWTVRSGSVDEIYAALKLGGVWGSPDRIFSGG